MKKSLLLFVTALLLSFSSFSQFNIFVQNPEAEQILLGNYDPQNYLPFAIINDPDSILQGVVRDVNKDTLLAYLMKIDTYYNRNTGSDTVSETRGIGAVRRWIHKKFMEYRVKSGERLVISYLDFDRYICEQYHHRNVMAILPGLDTTKKEMLILEGHYDTRCEGVCDTSCYSPGMEDNGSGTVLVMELARIMSRYAFDHTIVFTCVTGEDQGLYGATALAKYYKTNDLPIRAVFNNDVVGGIYCGNTSSPPSCPYLDHVDSTHVRLFSYSAGNDSSAISPHKQFARYIKMNQEELINPMLNTPMEINIIITEDRSGRSGDHIPFRSRGYTAVRFCSQNEHGDGSGTPPDRQHTTTDILGVDTSVPPDGVIDSFFVDMSYLSRNTISNGVNLGLLGIAPPMPEPTYNALPDGIEISLQGTDTLYQHYAVSVRTKGSGSLDWDTIHYFQGSSTYSIEGLDPDQEYYFSVANMKNGVESLFSDEFTLITLGINSFIKEQWGVTLMPNRPNPFSESTEFRIEVNRQTSYQNASLEIIDLSGRVVDSLRMELQRGMNSINYQNHLNLRGLFALTLKINGSIVQTRKLIIE